MSELVVQVVRLGFLVLLWLFVLSAVRAVRADLWGSRRPAQTRSAAAPRDRHAAARRPTSGSGRRQRSAASLVVVEGALAGTAVPLNGVPVTVGRDDTSTLAIPDDFASSHHARFVPRDGDWLVEDLGSTNGTYLDRTRVTGLTPVPLGVPVRIGKTVLELRP